MITEGKRARLVQRVVEGVVLDTRYNKDARELEHLLSYQDADGEEHQRWLLESVLQEVAE